MNMRLLKEKLVQSGMRKKEIAASLGISTQALNRKLRGETRFNTKDVFKLCEILQLENSSLRADIFLSFPLQK